jgi:hypothetical protein
MLAAISRACSVPAWASRHRFTTSCDDADAAESLDDIAENMEKEEEDKDKIKGAMNYSNLKNSLGGCGANTFDGFRVIVQKQVNLNTVVSHFYWVGSQQVGQLYQYRLILPFDDKMINVATDMDMNIEGEVSATLSENVSVSSTFGSGAQQGTKATVHCDIKDGTSATRLTYHNGDGGVAYAMSYVQAMTKALQLGGKGTYANGALRTSFAGLYDSEENTFGAAYGTTVSVNHAFYLLSLSLFLCIQYLPFACFNEHMVLCGQQQCYKMYAISIV